MTIEDCLLQTRLALPYYSRALAALTPVSAPGLGTVAVDEHWRLYFDLDFLGSLGDAQRVAVLHHELSHLLRDHHARMDRAGCGMTPRANIACDCELNDDIPDLPDGSLVPSEIGAPDGLTAEEYLAHVPEEVTVPITCGGGSGSGGPPLPIEIPPDRAGVPSVRQDEAGEIRRAVARDVLSEHRRKPGSIPGDLVVWAESVVGRSRTPWRAILRASLRGALRAGRSDWSWSRPRRREPMDQSILLPGSISRRPRVGIIIDTSGSMSDLGALALAEVRAITAFTDSREWDCDVAPRVRRSRRAAHIGGGGTDLRPAIAEAARWAGLTGTVVIVTDCETPWPDSAPSCRVIVAALTDEQSPPWAERIDIEEKR